MLFSIDQSFQFRLYQFLLVYQYAHFELISQWNFANQFWQIRCVNSSLPYSVHMYPSVSSRSCFTFFEIINSNMSILLVPTFWFKNEAKTYKIYDQLEILIQSKTSFLPTRSFLVKQTRISYASPLTCKILDAWLTSWVHIDNFSNKLFSMTLCHTANWKYYQ